MIVVTLTDCPPALRGDLSKWLMEINTGVYVGQVSARVRDKLWERITANIKNGRATMVFDAANEQKMDFRIHNTSWEIVDCDGLKLVRRPSEQRLIEKEESSAERSGTLGTSNASNQLRLNRIENAARKKEVIDRKAKMGAVADFTVVDIETTGLDPIKDSIIEIAALRVRDLEAMESFATLVCPCCPLPDDIASLTGLSEEKLMEQGVDIKDALQQFLQFIGEDILLIHNATFDISFLREKLVQQEMPAMRNRSLDTCRLARKALVKVPDYRLSTLAQYYEVDQPVQHRALADCQTAFQIYRKMIQTASN